MKTSFIAAALSAVAVAASASIARAEEPVVVQKTETVSESGGPSRAMMGSGLAFFGLTYVPSVVVAATSDRSADHRLFIPFAGPWLALPNRGDCGGDSGRTCNAETTYKVLLVGDGIIQALGGILFIRAFFSPEEHTTTTTSRPARITPTFHIAPTVAASGYGLGAVGTF